MKDNKRHNDGHLKIHNTSVLIWPAQIILQPLQQRKVRQQHIGVHHKVQVYTALCEMRCTPVLNLSKLA